LTPSAGNDATEFFRDISNGTGDAKIVFDGAKIGVIKRWYIEKTSSSD